MNFRFFEDLVGSAPGASQEFCFRKGKHSAKITKQRLLKKFSKIYIKFEKFSKNFQKFINLLIFLVIM